MTTSPAGTEAPRRVKTEALSRQADFDRIYREGKRQRGRRVTAIVLQRPEATGVRVAYVVSRKVARQAVRRNRVRRRLREALRSLVTEHGLVGQPDVILITAPQAVDASYWDLRAELRDLLGRAGLWARPVPEEGGG
ncbi:MAG: ribonuclease P protein component [Armatimonadetes bacterium]|nr:ribonuclease P protein component [Armatimonadota bacterium]